MEWYEALILGIIQGLTEFLPISSTAHLTVIPFFLGWNDPGVSVTASLQLGSIIAAIFYFWTDLSKLVHGISTVGFKNNFVLHRFCSKTALLAPGSAQNRPSMQKAVHPYRFKQASPSPPRLGVSLKLLFF
mgnify:CR=1 FL=1